MSREKKFDRRVMLELERGNLSVKSLATLLGMARTRVFQLVQAKAIPAWTPPTHYTGGRKSWRIKVGDATVWARDNGVAVPDVLARYATVRVLLVGFSPKFAEELAQTLESGNWEVKQVDDWFAGGMEVGAWGPRVLVADTKLGIVAACRYGQAAKVKLGKLGLVAVVGADQSPKDLLESQYETTRADDGVVALALVVGRAVGNYPK